MGFTFFVILIAVVYHHVHTLNLDYQKLKEETQKLEEEKQKLEELNQKLETDLKNPFIGNVTAHEEFQKAEVWRSEIVSSLYENVADNELMNASVWIAYADPFGASRSCDSKFSISDEFIDAFDDLIYNMYSDSQPFSNHQKRKLIAEHTYHFSGIEGNTLTLPEAAIVIDGMELLVGFQVKRCIHTELVSVLLK